MMDAVPIPDLVERVKQAKANRWRAYPVKSNRASQLGHPCLRRLVYLRLHWDKQLPPSPEMFFVFDAGKTIENEAIEELRAAGFEILEQQVALEIKRYNITGHLDFTISDDGRHRYPCDVKSMHPHHAEKMQTLDDLVNSGKPWLMSYPAQILLYMHMKKSRWGMLYIKNKATHVPHPIWVQMDDTAKQYVKELFEKAKQVNSYVRRRKLPDPIEPNDAICGYCEFRHICLPDTEFGKGVDLEIDIESAVALVERYLELKELVKEMSEARKAVEQLLGDRERIRVGDYIIEMKRYRRKAYTVPEGEVKRMKIIPLK